MLGERGAKGRPSVVPLLLLWLRSVAAEWGDIAAVPEVALTTVERDEAVAVAMPGNCK